MIGRPNKELYVNIKKILKKSWQLGLSLEAKTLSISRSRIKWSNFIYPLTGMNDRNSFNFTRVLYGKVKLCSPFFMYYNEPGLLYTGVDDCSKNLRGTKQPNTLTIDFNTSLYNK